MKIRPVRLPPCAAGASPSTSTRGLGIAEARERPAPVLLVANAARLTRATSSRQATSRGQRRQRDDLALELAREPARSSSPSARVRSGARSTRGTRPMRIGSHHHSFSRYHSTVRASPSSKPRPAPASRAPCSFSRTRASSGGRARGGRSRTRSTTHPGPVSSMIRANDRQVVALVRPAAVVDLARHAVRQRMADPAREVLHEQPVADVASRPRTPAGGPPPAR